MFKKITLLATAAPLSIAIPQVAHAQSDAAEEQGADKVIVVTARKRDERLQDVPVVVTAIDAASLERNAISSIDDVADFTPGLQSQESGSASNFGTIALRGVSNGTTTVAGDQAVAINVDGVQIESPLGLRVGQFDLEQVEILKGPQSLFFGKNSPGGVISIKTADPTPDFYAKARLGYEFEAEQYTGELVLSGPISDTLGFRFAGLYTNLDGFIQNDDPTAFDSTGPDYDEFILRGTLAWDPSDSFSARLKVAYAERSGGKRAFNEKIFCGNPAATTSDCTFNGRVVGAAPALTGENAGGRFPNQPFDEVETIIASLNLDWEVAEGLTLSSTTGYHDIQQSFFDSVNVRGATDVTIFGFNPVTNMFVFGPNEILFQSDDGTESFSQEVRLTSDFDGMFNFMIGAYYDNRTITTASLAGFGPIALPGLSQRVEPEAFSIFGQAIIDITDTLELSGGVRYTDEQKDFSGFLLEPILMGGFVAAPAGTPLVPADPVLNADNFSPEVTLTWKPNPDVTLFGSYKQGFKSGSFDTSVSGNVALAFVPSNIQFQNEDVEGGEFGFKTTIADGQLRLNGAVYYYDYTNLQLSVVEPGTVTTRTVNAASATVQGIELDALFTPDSLEGMTINASINYNEAEYDDFLTDCTQTQLFTGTCPITVLNGNPVALQNLSGEPLNRAPKLTFNAGFTLDRPVNDNLSYRFGSNVSYSSSFETESNNDPRGIQGSFLMLNANVGIRSSDDRWAFDIIGRNLNDERVLFLSSSQVFTGGGPFEQDFAGSITRGRQITARLTFQFGN